MVDTIETLELIKGMGGKMATAEYQPRIITLTLSMDEGEFLFSLLTGVGGDPSNSPRRYADSIRKALAQLGIEHKYTLSGSIYF